jgi:hypothetical protein
MRTQAMTRHKYTADYWNFTEEEVVFTDADGVVSTGIQRNYFFSKKIKLTLGVDTLQRLKVFADEPLPIFSQLRNIIDVSGTVVLKNGVWQVTGTESVLSAIGVVEGYRMQAKLIEGI